MSKVVVVLYIVLCLLVGILLSVIPWVRQGFWFGDWGNNFFLVWVVNKTGFHGLQHFVASGWVRGAVTGLGMLNLFNGFWEITHFDQAVRLVAFNQSGRPAKIISHETSAVDLSDIGRVDEKR
jgi:hypothetical protein